MIRPATIFVAPVASLVGVVAAVVTVGRGSSPSIEQDGPAASSTIAVPLGASLGSHIATRFAASSLRDARETDAGHRGSRVCRLRAASSRPLVNQVVLVVHQ